MVSLVGYTGFVGSNIYAKGKFDKVYNSKNIEEAYGTKPNLLIYSGLRAEKYLANTNAEADMELILQAKYNIEKIQPKRLVLISTVDVLKNPCEKNEDAIVETEGLHAYGLNRYGLEQWVRKKYPEALIIRLPGLYGINIKKNFLYDYLNVIPAMLNEYKFKELSEKEIILKEYYYQQENGFYKCKILEESEKKELKNTFQRVGYSALNFTDSRSVFQFYPLSRLWSDIQIALENKLTLWHPATEPVSAAEVYQYLSGEIFSNEIMTKPLFYDFRTKYDKLYGGKDGYIMNKTEILKDIKIWVEEF